MTAYLRSGINLPMHGLPFRDSQKVWVIAPSEFSSLSAVDAQKSQAVRKLIEEHRVAIERELGCGFEFTSNPHLEGAKWLIGPAQCNPSIQLFKEEQPEGPEIYLDRERKLLICDGTNPDEVTETYSYLRSLAQFAGGVWKIQDCQSVDDAVSLIYQEVKTTFPAFELKSLDWEKISEKHIPLVKRAPDPIAAMQNWLAELGDAHTWVRPFPPHGSFPYDLVVEERKLRFYRVPESTLAWEQGVRPGTELIVDDLEDWSARTSASTHSKPFLVGTRLLATKIGSSREFSARTSDGKTINWSESAVADRWSPLVNWKELPSGNAYLRINAWLLGKNLEEEVDAAFDVLRNSPRLIVDLRANPGGNLLLAHQFRNRFLKKDGPLGWIQTTLPDGQLSERVAILGTPSNAKQRWNNSVVFLTDPLTYSASEDVLLGLQGQSHVKVIGQSSGGGSGRMRLLRLFNGFRLTVSTSLTFDIRGNCVEGQGIRVDEQFPMSYDPEAIVQIADQLPATV
jgi:carboxyl-terminal processing protease